MSRAGEKEEGTNERVGGREKARNKTTRFSIIYDPSENNSTSVSRPSLVF